MIGRIVLFPLPLQGHINPMLQLANILHSKGFNITIIHTTFNSPNKSNYPHFTFEPLTDQTLVGNNHLINNINNVVVFLKQLNDICINPFRDCLVRLISNSLPEDPVLCLISDATLYFTQTVADIVKLRRIVLRTTSASSFHVFHSFPLLLDKGYLSMDDSQSEAPVAEVSPLKVKDVTKIFNIEEKSLGEMLLNIIKGTKAASGMIWNSFQELEHSILQIIHQDFPIPNFTIGPFHKYFTASSSSLFTQDHSAISWLNVQPPMSVLYVSFGSIVSIDKAEFLEMAFGLLNSMQRFLWVVRPRSIRDFDWVEPLSSELLEAVNERGQIVKWAPQQEVLAHSATACFWTHCGWNSTLESLCEGVPMICSPFFGDQVVNARHVEAVWKVGVKIENGFEKDVIKNAIGRIMIDQEGKEMRRRIVCLKEKVNLCLMKGGSSFKSLESLVKFILSM